MKAIEEKNELRFESFHKKIFEDFLLVCLIDTHRFLIFVFP